MAAHVRKVIIGLVLLLSLGGCAGGAFGGFIPRTEAIAEQTVVRQLGYFDQGQKGPIYSVAVTIPEGWVGSFSTTSNGSVLTFNYITPAGRTAPIFTIHALSISQFWKQNGSEPTQYKNIKATGDTYFIYNLPVDAFYSGLSREEYAIIAEQVPNILATFTLQ